MIEILRNGVGDIKAVCEYYLVDKDGHLDDNGEYVWISEVEVGTSYRNNGNLKEFIKIICEKLPDAKFGYFWRKKKYPKRNVRVYTRKQWLRLV